MINFKVIQSILQLLTQSAFVAQVLHYVCHDAVLWLNVKIREI